MTFKDYLAFYRINHTEDLFSAALSMNEIAYECGFNNLTSFIRAFKKFKHCTPGEYLKSRTTLK